MTSVEIISEMYKKVWEGKQVWNSGSKRVLRESQRIHEQFPGDPWIRFCNGYFKTNLFLMKGIMLCQKQSLNFFNWRYT